MIYTSQEADEWNKTLFFKQKRGAVQGKEERVE